MVRTSKVKYSRIALYWAPLTLIFTILWSIAINLLQVSGSLAAFSLAGPMILGVLASTSLYFLRDNQSLEYDERGFQESRARKTLEMHEWSEFTESSLVKDGYGHQKVRLYHERDGSHYDIDTSACGMDPYTFRDLASSHLNSNKTEDRTRRFIEGLERELQHGRTRWVADLCETFRDYQISGEVFPLVAHGGTRPKGFLLSRFFSYTLMPNYNVCMYAQWANGTHGKEQVMRLLRIIETQRDQKNIKWSWLLLLSEEPPSNSVSSLIEQFGNKDIGLGYINILSGELNSSPNQLGRSMANQMRMKRLVSDLRRQKYSVL